VVGDVMSRFRNKELGASGSHTAGFIRRRWWTMTGWRRRGGAEAGAGLWGGLWGGIFVCAVGAAPQVYLPRLSSPCIACGVLQLTLASGVSGALNFKAQAATSVL